MPGQQPPQAPPMPPAPKVFDVQSFEAAIQLLRDDKMRGFRVDIETQSTIAADEMEERQSASEFIQAVGAFMQSSLPMMQAMPGITPLIGKMLLFLIRRNNVGMELESSFEDAIAKIEGNPGAAMQNPDAGKGQAAAQMAQVKLQTAQMQAQSDARSDAADTQQQQIELQADQVKAGAEMRKALLDEQMARAAHARSLEEMQMQAAVQTAAPAMPPKLPFGAGTLTRSDR